MSHPTHNTSEIVEIDSFFDQDWDSRQQADDGAGRDRRQLEGQLSAGFGNEYNQPFHKALRSCRQPLA